MGLARMMEHGGMELHELHVLHCSLGAVDHGNAVASGNDGVGSCLVDCSTATSAHHCQFRQIGVHLLRLGVQHVGTIAINIRCAAGDACSQVVLRDDFHGKMILLHLDVGTVAYRLHQSALYFGTRVVGMVENAELRVAALAVQVERAVVFFVEVHTPVHQFLDLTGRHLDDLFNGLGVADVVAGNHRVFDVFVEVVELEVGHRGHTALSKRCVGLVERSLANHADLAFLGPGHLQGIAHAGHSGTDDEEIVFVNHGCIF